LVFSRHALSVADATDGRGDNGCLALIWRPVDYNVLRVVLLGIPDPTWFDLLGGAMKVIRRIAVATVAAAGLFVSMTGPAAADVSVSQHKHCLLTPNGWVLIAEGVSDEAYLQDAPALDEFHAEVHRGTPTGTGGLTIERIDANKDCSVLEVASAE
jgi:hypothetical protein